MSKTVAGKLLEEVFRFKILLLILFCLIRPKNVKRHIEKSRSELSPNRTRNKVIATINSYKVHIFNNLRRIHLMKRRLEKSNFGGMAVKFATCGKTHDNRRREPKKSVGHLLKKDDEHPSKKGSEHLPKMNTVARRRPTEDHGSTQVGT
jgi:hypothetical protein